MGNAVQSAPCTGSGLALTCDATVTTAELTTAVTNASNTAVITFLPGTYTHGTINLNARNGITLICQTEGACIETAGAVPTFAIQGFSRDHTNLIRVSGFKFTGSGNHPLWFYGNPGAFAIHQLRLDHNECSWSGGFTCIQLGDAATATGNVTALIDHINCNGPLNFVCFHITSGTRLTWPTGLTGTNGEASIYIEDSICNFTDITAGTVGSGCLDTYHGVHTVFRFNTVINSFIREHSYCHYGPSSLEVYGNDSNLNPPSGVSAGYRNIHLQGSGELTVWGNNVQPNLPNGHALIELQMFRSSTLGLTEGACNSIADGTVTNTGADPAHANDGNRAGGFGYPTWHQPGRDGNATLKPLYMFKNYFTGTSTKSSFLVTSNSVATMLQADCANTDAARINCHFQLNRDVYSEDAAFSGATGVGVGTLAAMPIPCTPTGDALDAGNGGVGYWATDQGSWNTSTSNPRGVQQNGADGVRYRCSALNTWTIDYTPFQYPHPWQGVTADTMPPGTATNLRVQ